MVLSNDERGWVMASVSGAACIIGASIICVDIIVRKFPSKRNFRIQDSDTFLSSSLSLSFGVMLFSALFSMMPSAKSSLQKGGMSPKAAAWTLIGCFLAGALGIQVISRLAHLFMPSHVVDCEHSHDEESAVKEPTEEDGQVRHEQAHPPSHDRSHGGSNAAYKQHGEHVHVQRPKISARKSTSAAADENGSATLPPGKSLSRRPSLQARLSQTLSSIASRSKSSCDCDGPCYGFSEPCGADCFKNMQTRQASTRSIIRQQLLRGESTASEQTPLLQSIRDENSPRPGHQGRMASDTVLQTKKLNSTPSLTNADTVIEEEEEDTHSLHHAKSHASLSSNQQRNGEQQPHHHHVPTNVFASIGLQTSIAIALHKLPEGFITFATNHVITSSLLYRVLISDTAIYLLHSQLSQHVGYKDQYHSIMIEGEDLLLCPTCGTQFDILAESPPSGYCRICDDPRQYIPATGQAWTSLKAEAGKHETKSNQCVSDELGT
ncbi:Zinc/iron permease [Aureobasidium pullulans]|uniref:Zinc/iron permease n=1 Tax=Aureobasidium pullulans TaxID=5580 RepID=A0A4T0E874_AURPU|nr:Zinc/iron permease [Aureobasidium pullulans]